MTQPCLEVRNLAYSYGKGGFVVRGVNLTVKQGTLTAIIGANGSGKSTLIRLMASLLQPATGEILLQGNPLQQWDARMRAREIAYMPQTTATAFPFLAIDMVLSGRTPHTMRFRFESASDIEKAMDALQTAGAAYLANRPVTSLSGGERQMVTLARALAQEPSVLLLDEPSSALDLKHRANLIRTLIRLRDTKRISVVMITHDLQLLGAFDQVVALCCGEVLSSGTPKEVLQDNLLRKIYDDATICSQQTGDQTLVWVNL